MRVVLVRSEHPANVGASARVIRNAGLEGLDLVAPAEWHTVECWRTAWGATEVLEQARSFGRLEEAVASAAYVVGFSRRAANPDVPSLDVRDAATEIASLPPSSGVALVFGPESVGLTLDELALCGRTAFIPSAPEQPSLNLSHAVAVAAHEVFRAWSETDRKGRGRAPARLATGAEKRQALDLLLRGLQALSALSDPRRGVYARLWRGLVQRSDLTPAEARLLAHLGRKMMRVGSPRRPPATRRSEPAEGCSPSQGGSPRPFADVQLTADGFSLPLMKWRELLFIGALRRDGDGYVRDPSHPLPPFERPGLFPDDARFQAEITAGRVVLRRQER